MGQPRIDTRCPVPRYSSTARSCRVVYDWAKPGDDIDEGFLREHGALPVDQALRGAYRLARVLNDLFDN